MNNLIKIGFFASRIYSSTFSDLLNIDYDSDTFAQETNAAKHYSKWWSDKTNILTKEYESRLGIGSSERSFKCYVVKNLPGNIPFAPPVTISYNYSSDKEFSIGLRPIGLLHEIVHYFECFDTQTHNRFVNTLKLIDDRYPNIDSLTRNHIVTSLVELPIAGAINVKNINFGGIEAYKEAYRIVGSLKPKYTEGNVFDYLDGVLK